MFRYRVPGARFRDFLINRCVSVFNRYPGHSLMKDVDNFLSKQLESPSKAFEGEGLVRIYDSTTKPGDDQLLSGVRNFLEK